MKASDWVRQETLGLKTLDAPQLSSAIGIKQSGRGTLVKNALGYMQTAGNNVNKNIQQVSIMTSSFSNANGLSIIPTNFDKCNNLFAARKLIQPNWINQKDEYLKPNNL